eukprot:6255686-Lingulodinium_polyedra.AAC.1
MAKRASTDVDGGGRLWGRRDQGLDTPPSPRIFGNARVVAKLPAAVLRRASVPEELHALEDGAM